MIIRVLAFFILIFLTRQNGKAQNDSIQIQTAKHSDIAFFRTARYCAGVNYGAIWAHNKHVNHLTQSHPVQVFGEIHFRNLERLWCNNFRRASAGVNITYFDYQSDVLGKSIAAITFLEPGLRKNMSFRIGTGVVYNTHPFDLYSNSTNLMLGSRFAMVMHCQVSRTFCYKSQVTEEMVPFLRLGIGLTHFSNGAFSQPNSGINNFFFSAGYCFGEQPGCRKTMTHPPSLPSDSLSFSIASSFSLVEKFPVGGPKYAVYQIQGRVRYRIGKLSRLQTGLDWMKNQSVAAEIIEQPQLGTQAAVLGIPFGHELLISQKLSMITELGVYIYKKHQLHPGMYQRYGLRYQIWKGAFSGIMLKTHRAKAECLELNLGYQL
ncbi:MAG TPA: acyloxyacyl hydrolase [Catalimonadaceae bacterium]|nr:acyloxyacyl hydrolase [Catalimonadaceae bacterium]